jgi:hypothetical protein
MDRTLHDYIDGELARDELTAAQGDELESLEAAIRAVVSPLREAAAPDLSARVMARVAEIRREPSPGAWVGAAIRRSLDWVWAPRLVRLRPAYALATLSVFAVFAVVASPPLAPSHDLQAVGDRAHDQVYVQFRLEASGASQVALVGSFTAWQPDYELRETAPGTWSILVPLRPGVYDYAFVVDGREWVADPHAFQIDDGFGGTNSRIALPSPPTGYIQS